MPEQALANAGRVYLVGAGPGDPGLLTLRGAECLRRADLVLYDYLANPQLLELAAPAAKLVCLGRHGQGRLLTQDEVNRRMIEAALAGHVVVRLKGGDPLVFARAAEECAALAAAGVPCEIVPGITAALAAGSYAGVALTDRRWASAVALIAGHEDDDKEQPPLDYTRLASFPGTLVFYMGVTSAPVWSEGLLDGGLPADTPVALVRRCSWPDQIALHTTLGEVAAVIHERKVRPPTIAIVGAVAGLEPVADWFTNRALFGQRIVITRPAHQNDALRTQLSELGAEVLVQPAIEIAPPPDLAPLDAALARLADYEWLVFSSANGVRFLLDRLLAMADVRRLGQTRLAAIGPATAEELARYSLRADLVPGEYRAEGLAAELTAHVAGKKVLLARASRGREVLAEQLRAAGATVEQVVVYESRDTSRPHAEVAAALAGNRIDWVTVTSSAIARSLARLFGPDLRRAKLASISPITSGTLRELGYEVAAEAREYTTAGLIAAILRG